MGITQSQNNTDSRWNDIKTVDMESSIPGIRSGLSNDAKLLLKNINLPEISTNSESDNLNNIFGNNSKGNIDQLSESPFISSEMYNFMLNKNIKNNKNNLHGGSIKDDAASDTSSTSSPDGKSRYSLSDSDSVSDSFSDSRGSR